MIFLLVTGGICLMSILAFLILIRKSGAKPSKVVPVREQEFKTLFGIKGFRRDFVETEDGTIAFFRIMPNNLTVLPEAVIEYQIEQMKQLLQRVLKERLLRLLRLQEIWKARQVLRLREQ